MARHCPTCQRPVLPSDTTCWQCGARLPASSPESPKEDPPSNHKNVKARELLPLEPLPPGEAILTPDTAGPPPLIIYSLLTVGLLVAALFLLGQLAAPPLLQATWQDYPPARWSAVTAPDYSYTLNVPDAWQWQMNPTLGDEDGLEVSRITRPWTALSPAWEPIFLASPTAQLSSDAPFVLVLRSETLRNLPTTEAFAYLQTRPEGDLESLTITNLFIAENSNRTYVGMTSVADGLRCRQHYVHGRAAALLVVGCGQGVLFGQNLRTLTPLLESFEYLRRSE